MLQAFQADPLDVGYVADSPLIFAQAAQQSVTGVAAWAPKNGDFALVTAPGVRITGWAALKGKKVAYQQGTVEAVLEGLKSVGLSLKDITPVNLARQLGYAHRRSAFRAAQRWASQDEGWLTESR